MTTSARSSTSVPAAAPTEDSALTRELRPLYLLSVIIGAITAIATIAGLTYGPDLYGAGRIAGVTAGPAGVLVPGFVAQDVLTLGVGLPLLLATVWLAWRGSFVGLLLWLGMIFNLLYTYVHYLVGAPVNILFIAYVALVTLCALTLFWSVARIDADQVRDRLVSSIAVRVLGGVLVVLALMTIGQDAGGAAMSALAEGPRADPEARRVWVADLTTAAPAMLVVGVLLWRRAAIGFVAGAGLLLSFSLFSAELAAMLALQPLLTGAGIDLTTIVGLVIFAVAGLVPLVLIVRSQTREDRLRWGRRG